MIKISVNANRSDIAGYISYYSSKELAPLLEIDEKDIIYETSVVDYFAFGDVDFNTRVETLVTISDSYVSHMDEIADILAKYLSGFVSEFTIRYEIVDSHLIYDYKVEGNPHNHECECGCHHEGGEEHECHHHEGECGENCECHHHECKCGEHHECNCNEGECDCKENCECDDCKCDEGCSCKK